MRMIKRRWSLLSCLFAFCCVLLLVQRNILVNYAKFIQPERSSGRIDVAHETANDSTLTYYSLRREHNRTPELSTKRFRDAVEQVHLKHFVKPDNEECVKRYPSCIIIGVDKCGTWEMAEFLHLHPLVQVFYGKTYYEMDYFGRNYSKGDKWFRNEMPCSYSNQITLMKHSTYFHRPYIAKRIHDFNANIKLILMVREPVSRTISRFMFERNMGRLDEKTAMEHVIFSNFSQRPGEAINLTNKVVNEKHNLIDHSTYDEPMKQWLRYFKLSQIMIVEMDEFKYKPATVLSRVESFLGLPHSISPDTFVWNSEKGYFCIKSEIKEIGMSCYGNERGKQQIQVQPETREFLKQYFEQKNRNFFNITGKTFDWN